MGCDLDLGTAPVLRTLRLSRLDAALALYPTLAGARAWLRERPAV